jgi:predicted MFS family arabinose efflux permease
MLVILLSLNFGVLFFDRNALNFLMPSVKPDLHLDNFQVGLLASALSLTWALAGFLVGHYSDSSGKRKSLILIAGVAFALCSFVSGLAQSFLMLLGARLLMGFAEGGVMPISQSIIAQEVDPEHTGLAMGVAQNFGSNLLGSAVAPIVLVWIAQHYGWRDAFYVAGVPGLIMTAVVWKLVHEPPALPPRADDEASSGILDILRRRNIVVCILMAICLVPYLVICWAFMPLFLTEYRKFPPETGSWLMAALGISATTGSIAVSALSDRIGRRPVMIAFPLLGVILPLAAIYFPGSPWILGAIFFVGWSLVGVFPLFMATVPSESVSRRQIAGAAGIVMGTGEILGGVLGPALAGKAADHFGLQAPLWIMFGLCIVAGLLAFGLRETAPRVVARQELAVA